MHLTRNHTILDPITRDPLIPLDLIQDPDLISIDPMGLDLTLDLHLGLLARAFDLTTKYSLVRD